MTSKQRVFSHLTDINYNDYLKNKIGVEVLKNIKGNNKKENINGFIIKKFVNHSDLINLTKTYYNYYNLDKYSLQPTKDLYNSNNSFVDNKLYKIDNNSKEDDVNCKNSKVYNVCEDLSQVLYPYGVYNSNTPNLYLHFNLDLNKWCVKKNIIDYNSSYNLEYTNINIDGFNGCSNSNSCNTNNNNNNNNNKNVYNSHSLGNDLNETKKDKCKTGLCKNAKPLFI